MKGGKPIKKPETKKMLCQRIQKLEQWITTVEEERIIVVTHGGIISHLFDRFFEGRKVDNIGMFQGTLVSPGDENGLKSLPYWKDVQTFKSQIPGNPQWMPTVIDPPDAEYPQEKLDPKGERMCLHHSGTVVTAPGGFPLTVKGVECDKKCQERELALTADYAYLIRKEFATSTGTSGYSNYIPVDDGTKKLLHIRSAELFVSNFMNLEVLLPAASDPSWKPYRAELQDMPKSFMLKRDDIVLLRFRCIDETDYSTRKVFIGALATAASIPKISNPFPRKQSSDPVPQVKAKQKAIVFGLDPLS
eukprot:gnl/MRDRNA2_/MRDRNA2_66947_c0_seq1.p1 gnl/MRDRNA2_/MRDRNA2_66947_c0~~gnl/MRDRNA2_/MRDRNA2_66947_c0_seq1.p1  ORF type:complete len:304 (-),score=47.46 gnl/MRDRNA2_/MRDRNA2_66947_c0_seq1:92-1003(-)